MERTNSGSGCRHRPSGPIQRNHRVPTPVLAPRPPRHTPPPCVSESRRVCAGCDSGSVVQKQGCQPVASLLSRHAIYGSNAACVTSIYGRFVFGDTVRHSVSGSYWGGRRPPRAHKLSAAAALRRLRRPGRCRFFSLSPSVPSMIPAVQAAGTSTCGRLDRPATCAAATGGLREPDPLLPQVPARAAARLHRVVERLPARRAPRRLESTRAARRPARVARLPLARAGR